MSWRVIVRPEIEQDLTEAANWYDSREEGLGDRFIAEVMEVVEALERNPCSKAAATRERVFAGVTHNIFPIASSMRLWTKTSAW
jgi:hypothetical protein